MTAAWGCCSAPRRPGDPLTRGDVCHVHPDRGALAAPPRQTPAVRTHGLPPKSETVIAAAPLSASPRSAGPAGATSAPAGRDDARREALGLQVVAARRGAENPQQPSRSRGRGLGLSDSPATGGRRLARPAAPRPLCPSPLPLAQESPSRDTAAARPAAVAAVPSQPRRSLLTSPSQDHYSPAP